MSKDPDLCKRTCSECNYWIPPADPDRESVGACKGWPIPKFDELKVPIIYRNTFFNRNPNTLNCLPNTDATLCNVFTLRKHNERTRV